MNELIIDKLIDAITNMIDENIRRGMFSSYEEWQEEVERVIYMVLGNI